MAATILVTLAGEVLDADEPLLYADDLAAVRGDGVFETLLVLDGKVCCLDRHLQRLTRSAAALDLPEPDLDRWRGAIETGLQQWRERADGPEATLRLCYSRGRESRPDGSPTGYLTIAPVPASTVQIRAEGVAVLTADRGYSVDFAAAAPWQLLGAKTLSYATNMAAVRYAQRNGADDVIYLSSEGLVLEGTRSSVLAVFGDKLVTPPAEAGILAGTTVQALFDHAATLGWSTAVDSLAPAALLTADSVWLVSSVTRATRVHTLNGHALNDVGRVGEIPELVKSAVLTG